jgi:hypothetical protein
MVFPGSILQQEPEGNKLDENLDDQYYASRMIASVYISAIYPSISTELDNNKLGVDHSICAVTSSDPKSFLNPVILGDRWGIDLAAAKVTI